MAYYNKSNFLTPVDIRISVYVHHQTSSPPAALVEMPFCALSPSEARWFLTCGCDFLVSLSAFTSSLCRCLCGWPAIVLMGYLGQLGGPLKVFNLGLATKIFFQVIAYSQISWRHTFWRNLTFNSLHSTTNTQCSFFIYLIPIENSVFPQWSQRSGFIFIF